MSDNAWDEAWEDWAWDPNGWERNPSSSRGRRHGGSAYTPGRSRRAPAVVIPSPPAVEPDGTTIAEEEPF